MRRILLAAGGTGGHIFPAIATAQVIRQRDPGTEILFVGAKGGMEERLVPEAGFELRTVYISGLRRRLTVRNMMRNLMFPIKYMTANLQATAIVRDFKPDVAVGFGGYASFPALRAAAKANVRTAIMEQNAFPGLANRKLAPRVDLVMLGNEAAKSYLKDAKQVTTGNPVRPELLEGKKEAGLKRYGFSPEKSVLLVLGGSLGAGSINEALIKYISSLIENDIQVLWQCGKSHYDLLKPNVPEHPQIKLVPFISEMGDAYAIADLVVARAGALTIAELECLGKAAILVPSPNVAADHQTANARALSDKQAAVLIKDAELNEKLGAVVMDLLRAPEKLSKLRTAIRQLAKPDATERIVNEIYRLAAC